MIGWVIPVTEFPHLVIYFSWGQIPSKIRIDCQCILWDYLGPQHVEWVIISNLITPSIFCNNIGVSYLNKISVFHTKIKHIVVDFHYLQNIVKSSRVIVKYLSVVDQIADTLRKLMPKPSVFIQVRHWCTTPNLRGVLRFLQEYVINIYQIVIWFNRFNNIRLSC